MDAVEQCRGVGTIAQCHYGVYGSGSACFVNHASDPADNGRRRVRFQKPRKHAIGQNSSAPLFERGKHIVSSCLLGFGVGASPRVCENEFADASWIFRPEGKRNIAAHGNAHKSAIRDVDLFQKSV